MPSRMTSDSVYEHDDELARLDCLFVEALRLDAGPRRRAHSTPALHAAPLAEACRLSRARGLQPERVIIMLKGTWGRLRDTSYASLDEAHDALDRAVSTCIEQYFAEQYDHEDDDGARR
jgi:hypothetical protein